MQETIAAVTTNPITLPELRLYCTIPHTAYDSELELEALAAIEYIEQRTEALLVRRQVTAVYSPAEPIRLRGPNPVVTSVTSNGTAVAYTIEQRGHLITAKLSTAVSQPVQVIYTAGYTSLPALVRQSIKSYVRSHYRNREAAAQVQLHDTPHGLEAAINVLNRGSRVG